MWRPSMVVCHFLLILSLSTTTILGKKKDPEPVPDDKATEYLLNYGYVEPGKLQEAGGVADKENILEKAVKAFQEMANLKVTGKLDVQTKKKMAQPRCGMQDAHMIVGPGGGPRWRKDVVTFKIHNFSPDLDSSRQRAAIKRAYDTWGEVIPVRFQETSGQADINVLFASRSHGDPWPFDGRSGVLAHATMPTDGKLHFDEDERWALGPEDEDKIANGYTDLFPVAVHEIGHTLGLEHSKVENAIMAPFYQESVDDNGNYIPQRLKPDDIRRIQELYGAGRGGGGRTSSSSFGGGGSGRGSSSSGGRGSSSGRGRGGFGGGDDDWGSSFGGRGSPFGGGSSGRGSSGGSSFGGLFGDDDWGGLFGSSGRSRGGSGGRTSSTSSWSSPDGRSRGRVTVSGTDWPSSRHHGSSGGGGLDIDRLFSKWLGKR